MSDLRKIRIKKYYLYNLEKELIEIKKELINENDLKKKNRFVKKLVLKR